MTDTRLAIIVTATLTCPTIASNLYGNWATRRQMRQNELRRADPSIPVEPPPTAAGLFIRKWAFFILAVAAHVYILTHIFRQPTASYD